MSVFHEIPPTAGFPFRLRDVFPAGKKGTLDQAFERYLGAPYARVTYSGTAGFYFILEAMKRLSSKRTVVVPAFVCPLVPLAVARAGLKIEVCDICPDRFDYDPEALARLCRSNPDILAVVAVHLAGIPVDMDALREETRARGIFLVEDAAQSLGAEYKGKKVGTLGDFGFFSLCRGKGLTIYEGGVVVVTNEKHAVALQDTVAQLEKKDVLAEGLKILELVGYWFFYRPFLFWFVFKGPQKFWLSRGDAVRAMGEYADVSFSTHQVSGFRKAYGHATFSRLGTEIARQREKAKKYFRGLEGLDGIQGIKEIPDTRANYPYVTVVFRDRKKRDQALAAINKEGLGASIVYVHALTDYDYLKTIIPSGEFPRARQLAARTMTLSTSVFLQDKELSRVVEILKGIDRD